MSTRPWFPFYPGDFYQDSALLTLEQQGAYIRLLAYAWTHDGVIPGDSSGCPVGEPTTILVSRGRKTRGGFWGGSEISTPGGV